MTILASIFFPLSLTQMIGPVFRSQNCSTACFILQSSLWYYMDFTLLHSYGVSIENCVLNFSSLIILLSVFWGLVLHVHMRACVK